MNKKTDRPMIPTVLLAWLIGISLLHGTHSRAQVPRPVPKQAGICDRIYADVAEMASDLQDILDRCDWDTDGFVLALRKLNHLPPPAGLKAVVLKPYVAGRPVKTVTLEIDVFFNLLQSYPHVLAFPKLEQLTERISSGYEIQDVEIVGYSDRNEHQELTHMTLDTKRAEFIRAYFVAVGVPPERVRTSINLPRHENTATGRARDRSVAVKVHFLSQDQSYAEKVRASIQPIIFSGSLSGNPVATIEVTTAEKGVIVGRRLIRSSGDRNWDEAVERAVYKTDVIPADVDGRVPHKLEISFSPKNRQ
ncbi:TonB C-terminal domain-containing protein [Acidovorax sp.]|uniref:TonB C-terminal domain-containing protein n=1 Tax=Acidovorax sp. TaxID=1872122 RepID=UPI0025BD1ED2|nr:TonB C-terminal domain-containing protein [Acidovorax sp.]MCI5067299.1 TonB C-terminal domain-containing protein [Acidovorax sp.]